MDIDIDIKLDAGHRQSRLKKNKNLLVGNPICSNVVTKNIKEKKKQSLSQRKCKPLPIFTEEGMSK
jgi:hypothetical protein